MQRMQEVRSVRCVVNKAERAFAMLDFVYEICCGRSRVAKSFTVSARCTIAGGCRGLAMMHSCCAVWTKISDSEGPMMWRFSMKVDMSGARMGRSVVETRFCSVAAVISMGVWRKGGRVGDFEGREGSVEMRI